MTRERIKVLAVAQQNYSSTYEMYTNDGNYSFGQTGTSPSPATITWRDYITDAAPSLPVLQAVKETKFAWKAKYGTVAAREQFELAIERRATLARNQQLRSKYFNELKSYKARSQRLVGVASPNVGSTYKSTRVFNDCEQSKYEHNVSFGAGVKTASNAYWWTSWGWAIYRHYVGVYNSHPTLLPVTTDDLVTCFGTDHVYQPLSVATVCTNELKKKVLEDTSLLNFKGGKFSLLTFIAELSDLRHLPSLLTKWTKSAHDISDKYLGVSFGVLPFYSDIKAIFDRLNNLPYAIAEWNRNAQDAQIRSYHITVDPIKVYPKWTKGRFYTKDKEDIVATWKNKANGWIRMRTTASIDRSIRAHLYLVPEMISEDKVGLLTAHIWGIESPLKTIYDKIPFTFVVDWFTRLGDIIQEVGEIDDLLRYRIIDAGYSCKTITTWKTTQGANFDTGDLVTLRSKNTFYERKSLNLANFGTQDSASIQLNGLSLSQGFLSAALIHQQLKR